MPSRPKTTPSGANLLLRAGFSLKTSFVIEVRYHTRSNPLQALYLLAECHNLGFVSAVLYDDTFHFETDK